MAKNAAVVGIVGASAMRRDLKKLGEQGSKMLVGMREAARTAAEPVLTRTRGAWPRSTLSHAHHADTVRVRASRTGATVAEGDAAKVKPGDPGAKFPATGWLEFGGTRHRPHESMRERMVTGNWLYPAAQGLASVVIERYSDAIQKALDDSSSWTNSGNEGTEVSD